MQLEVEIYRDFTIYSIVSSYIRLIFSFILEKMYFEGKEKKAYINSIIFNLLNLVLLIGIALITKNVWIIIGITLGVIFLYVLILLIKQFHKFKLDFNILSNFKYESANIVIYIILFVTYFIGYSNAFQAGEEYVVAINFVALITDSQWDCCEAMSTVAKIDIAKGKYNYKLMMKHSLIYSMFVALTSIILFFSLFNIYGVDIKIGLICLSVEIVDFLYNPITYAFEPFVQLEHSATINTIISLACYVIRCVLSIFIPLAYCTQIGQGVASFIGFTILLFIRYKFYRSNKEGLLEKRIKNSDQKV